MSLALVLTVVVIALVAVLAGRAERHPVSGPLAIPLVDQPAAATASCRTLDDALSDDLAGLARRQLVGQTEGVAAWGDPAVVLRCGVTDPRELTCSAALVDVSRVQWLQLSDIGQTTYLAVDRPVRIALTLPDGTGTGAIQEISAVVDQVLPARSVCDGHGSVVPARG
ncbi:DUF3515 domain-containing protein [Nakamurella endophytica]|uniref:DUF3515 domain-containing protein n=1 Tax=Nakamurella endophytica TaxID=1748367 RepID=A0A917SJE0_9ACTN|nr:DUF3515 domain-containing protein [Nakamurella endophytica]GGL84950.1 hypothetical protein GCM10011594_00670 [Nakamurella endophytica]